MSNVPVNKLDFRIFRPVMNPASFSERERLAEEYPDHELRNPNWWVVPILNDREVRRVLRLAGREIHIKAGEIAMRLVEHGPESSFNGTEVGRGELVCSPRRGGGENIDLTILDDSGVLTAERNYYQEWLAKITGTEIIEKPHQFRMSVGKTLRTQATPQLLEAINGLIDPRLDLAKVDHLVGYYKQS